MQLNVFPSNNKNPSTGYGAMEIGLISGLRAIGCNVTEVNKSKPANGGITIIVGDPGWGVVKAMANTRRWLFTMSESTRISDKWVKQINTLYECVLVPTPELIPIYVDSGVSVPVHYVPLGVDLHTPEWVQRDPNPEVFTWLTYFLGDTRKGADLALFAFNRLFGGNSNHRLVIKCRDDLNWMTGLQDPQIEIVKGEQTVEELHALLARANAFIFASRGEGFGLPPREATLSGLPTIATEWLGMFDIRNWGYGVRVKALVPNQFDKHTANHKEALWSEPDSEDLDRQMLYVVNHYQECLDSAEWGRGYLLKGFKWTDVAHEIVGLMDEQVTA